MVNEYKNLFLAVKQKPQDMWIIEHLDNLYNLTKAMDAQSVIELGVQTGQSTAAFLYALSETGGKLWSVDITPLWGRIKDITAPFWTFTQASDLDVVKEAPQADIIFIDTNHEYEHTKRELIRYSYKLNDGGIFILHDTYNLDTLGVFAALMEFTSKKDWHFYNYNYCSGLGVVGKDLSKVSHLFSRGKQWL